VKIEIFGPFNPDGSTMPLTEYEIEDGCERVLYAPHQPLSYGRGPLWGFQGRPAGLCHRGLPRRPLLHYWINSERACKRVGIHAREIWTAMSSIGGSLIESNTCRPLLQRTTRVLRLED